MDIVNARCAGLDVHKSDGGGRGGSRGRGPGSARRDEAFATTTRGCEN